MSKKKGPKTFFFSEKKRKEKINNRTMSLR